MDTCLTEKRWLAIAPRPFTADGGKYGQVTVASTLDFKVKQQVRLKSNTQTTKALEIKRVISITQLIVGPKGNIQDREDITAFLVADGATIEAEEQSRAAIPYQQYENAVYAEEPIIAKRSILVDRLGCYYDSDNPLPVTVEEITIDNVSVQLDHISDGEGKFDSVRIGNGILGRTLEINPDGSINVIQGVPAGEPVNTFNEISSVASGIPTTVATYTVPLAGLTNSYLQKISCSGTNVAQWTVRKNGSVIDRRRTYFTEYDVTFEWQATGTLGEKLSLGDVIIIEVLHSRPMVGTFNARIQAVEI